MGNNGGDGLAAARLLYEQGYEPEVWMVHHTDRPSADFSTNLRRLSDGIPAHNVTEASEIPHFGAEDLVVDALFGSGLTRPAQGLAAAVIASVSRAGEVIAVDIPSGLFMDAPNQPTDAVVRATHTVSFQLPKLAFLLPQNAEFVGEWHLADIGLHSVALSEAVTDRFYFDEKTAKTLLRPRQKYAHKGTHGHALLVAGSRGMMGAAMLAAWGCLRAGVGKLTVHAPHTANDLLQMAVPEALFAPDENDTHTTTIWTPEKLAGYAAIGIGPGLGVGPQTAASLGSLLENAGQTPLVLDADALNNLSENRAFPPLAGSSIWAKMPENAILTPHPREFRKLLGRDWQNDYEKLGLLTEFAVAHRVVVCLKGAHTAVALPDGTLHFNSTGNPGMATGGTGDVLTGILTALLAQGYPPAHAAQLGVYLHGSAGDHAAAAKSVHSLTASDLPEFLPAAFRRLSGE
jgi:NAD(P)H-hydrate epimerase